MVWQLSKQWVSHLGSRHVPNGLATLQPHWTARVVTDEVHLVLDRYDLPTSLKEATIHRRQGDKPATAYHVTDNTPISKMSAKQFLSSTTTKDELTVYLAKKALHHFEGKPKDFIVTSRQETLSNSMDVQHLCSPQEEANTRLILTVWMLLEEEQQNSTFSHLTLMSLSLQFTVTISSAGTLTSSLAWGTRSG